MFQRPRVDLAAMQTDGISAKNTDAVSEKSKVVLLLH
jgi:hypothetical protein